jgi:hypothetical protein
MNTSPEDSNLTDRYLELVAIKNRCEDQLDRTPEDKALIVFLSLVDQELELLANGFPF